jgi:hypothetical protein
MGDALLDAFLNGRIDPRTFSHADHVGVAFALLQQGSFLTAAASLSAGLRSLAAQAGNGRAYHETMTFAFLSRIAERRAEGRYGSEAEFLRTNQDLLDKSIIARWYDPARLSLEVAGDNFILPEPAR